MQFAAIVWVSHYQETWLAAVGTDPWWNDASHTLTLRAIMWNPNGKHSHRIIAPLLIMFTEFFPKVVLLSYRVFFLHVQFDASGQNANIKANHPFENGQIWHSSVFKHKPFSWQGFTHDRSAFDCTEMLLNYSRAVKIFSFSFHWQVFYFANGKRRQSEQKPLTGNQ